MKTSKLFSWRHVKDGDSDFVHRNLQRKGRGLWGTNHRSSLRLVIWVLGGYN